MTWLLGLLRGVVEGLGQTLLDWLRERRHERLLVTETEARLAREASEAARAKEREIHEAARRIRDSGGAPGGGAWRLGLREDDPDRRSDTAP